MNKDSFLVKAIKSCLFLVAGCLIYIAASKVLIIPYEQHYQFIKGFYEEPYDSIDATYIGASGVYTSWVAPVAWEKYGIKVFPYSTGAQPAAASPYLIDEIHKTQPSSLIVFAINSLYIGSPAIERIHQLADNMPLSITKIKMLWELCDICGIKFMDRLEFYFPIIRFHTRWNALVRDDFHRDLNHLEGGWVTNDIFYDTKDLTGGGQIHTEYRGSMTEYAQNTLNRVLDYCDDNHVNIIFVITPSILDDSKFGLLNSAKDMISKRGYAVLDLTEKSEEIGLDLKSDYYNWEHTNIHGALKVTDWMGKYLAEQYGFGEKHPTGGDAAWDSAYDRYYQIILPYLSEKEIQSLNQ